MYRLTLVILLRKLEATTDRYKQKLCAVCLTPFHPTTSAKQQTCSKSCGAKLRWIKKNRVDNAKKEIEEVGADRYVDRRWSTPGAHTDKAVGRLIQALAGTPSIEEHRVDRAARNGRVPRKLTPRMQDVLLLAARGFTQQETAERLGISPDTVKNHQNNILVYFHANTITQAVAVAQKMDIVPTPTLTDKDRQLLNLIAVGKRDKEIGVMLDRPATGVKESVKTLLGKFGVRNRTAMISRAIDLGML